MLTLKKHGHGGDFFRAVFYRRHDAAAKAWGRKPLCQVLRGQRESLKISLPEAARLTGLPVKYLRLLEGAGEEQLLAEPLSLIPALPRYAAFLNLNADIAVAQFIAALEQLPPVTGAGGGARRTQLLRYVPQPRARVLRRTSLLLLTLGLLPFVGYYGVRAWDEGANTEQVASRPPPSTAAPAPQCGTSPLASWAAPSAPAPVAERQEPFAPPPAVAPPVAAVPRAEPSAVPPPRPTASVADSRSPRQKSPRSTPHRLRVQATAKTWFHLTVDDQRMQRFFLRPGQSLEWTAEKGFTVSLGNAAAIRLTLDGHELPPLAKAGQRALHVRLPSPRRSQEREVRKAERLRVRKPR
jgi:cytoskeletal protein RodZ